MASKGQLVQATSKPKSHGKKFDRLNARPGENGGWIVTHYYKEKGPDPMYHEPEDFIFGKEEGGKVLAHIGKHLGIKGSSEEAGESSHNG